MSRPTRYGPRTTTALRLPAELHGQVQAAAEERDLSVNDLITRLIEHGLPRLRPVAPTDLFLTDDEVHITSADKCFQSGPHIDSPADSGGVR